MSYATLDEFRGRRRSGGGSGGFPIIIALSGVMILLGVIIGATELIAYSEEYNNTEQTFGNDVLIGGVQVGGLNEADRLTTLESVYVEQPILLNYDGSPILLTPNQIGFRLDTESMQAAANAQVDSDFWGGFWRFLWRQETRRIDIPLYAEYDPADLRAYLEELSLRYDTDVSRGGFDIGTGTFRSAGTANRLDIDAAIPLIQAALFQRDPTNRRIELPITTSAGRALSIEDLEAGIIEYIVNEPRIELNSEDSIVSVFVLDLQTGEEVNINSTVLHDGTSNVKVGIMINYFRYQITDPSAFEKRQLANAIICSDNGDANNLMLATSIDGSYISGIRNVNDTFCAAGAPHTKVTTNLFIGSTEEANIPDNYYTIVQPNTCPAESFTPLDPSQPTNSSPQVRTTAADMGTMLMNIYDCAMGGGGLQTIFEGEITQTECQQMVEVMRGTTFLNMMELGVPEGTDLAHKVGYVDDTSGDVGIVMTPGGDYIFAMFIWERDGRGDGILFDSFKWDIFGGVNRVVYNYFNPTEPLTEVRQPAIPGSGVSCVLPQPGYEINLFDIEENRFTPEGIPDTATGCYDPAAGCRPFDNWGFAP